MQNFILTGQLYINELLNCDNLENVENDLLNIMSIDDR